MPQPRYHTPLRYPGGKQKIAPFISEILHENRLIECDYVEPYAGGAGVALDLLFSGVAKRVHLNDSCSALYSVWWSALNQTDDFCRRIRDTPLTVEEWQRQRAVLEHEKDHSAIDVGFSFFFLNRCNRSGIVRAGPIGGFEQRGPWTIGVRFPREELIRRIEKIAHAKDYIHISNQDAENFLLNYVGDLPKKSTLVYCDPPYFTQGKRLYLNHYRPADHKRIARLIRKRLKHHWLVSYDNVPEVMENYTGCNYFTFNLQYNAGVVYQGTEVFFFSSKLKLPGDSNLPFIASALSSYHAR